MNKIFYDISLNATNVSNIAKTAAAFPLVYPPSYNTNKARGGGGGYLKRH